MRKLHLLLGMALTCAVLLLNSQHAAAGGHGVTYIINGKVGSTDTSLPDDDVKKNELLDETYSLYTDYANGYSFRYPGHMTVDWSLSAVCTVFKDETTRIEIYYDNFQGKLSSAHEYINYGNWFLKNTRDHTLIQDDYFENNGQAVRLLKWVRRSLPAIKDDKNNYVSLEIITNPQEVYTIFIKSKAPIENELELLQGFSLVARRGKPGIYRNFGISRSHFNTETKTFYEKHFSDTSPLYWGIFEQSAPEVYRKLTELENRLSYKFRFLVRYQTLDEELPENGLLLAYDRKKYVELTLQTVRDGHVDALGEKSPQPENAGIVYDILAGKYEEYFNRYAQKLRRAGIPVLFRLNNEMNGDWCWYSAFYTGKDTEMYKALWRYIYTVFTNNGVDNVVWVWNPHDLSRPDFKWNHYLMYYPGDEYVDVIGMTGYNTGCYFKGERWREFSQIYDPIYHEYTTLFDKPLIITEFGSNSVGGDKVAWIRRMFEHIRQFDKIKIAIWWNGIDYDKKGQPGRIYLIDEDEAVLQAFRENLQYFK